MSVSHPTRIDIGARIAAAKVPNPISSVLGVLGALVAFPPAAAAAIQVPVQEITTARRAQVAAVGADAGGTGSASS